MTPSRTAFQRFARKTYLTGSEHYFMFWLCWQTAVRFGRKRK